MNRGGGDMSSSSSSSDEEYGVYIWKGGNPQDTSVSELARGFLLEAVKNRWVRYWIGLLAAVVSIDFSTLVSYVIWFVLGFGACFILSSAFWKMGEGRLDLLKDDNNKRHRRSVSPMCSRSGFSTGGNLHRTTNNNIDEKLQLQNATGRHSWKSQGWLLTLLEKAKPEKFEYSSFFYPNPIYDSFNNRLREMNVVFAQLNGSSLTLSVPHRRHRIPKRRLWSDPPALKEEHIFVQHHHYDLFGASITLAPDGITRGKVWSRKYPIKITVWKDTCGKSEPEKNESPDKDNMGDGDAGTSKDAKENENAKNGDNLEGPKKKVRQHSKGEVKEKERKGSCKKERIYLFCRCDREKDDWFRRLVAATKVENGNPRVSGNEAPSASSKSPNFSHLLAYMHRMCPSMIISPSLMGSSSPRSTKSTNLLFETVTMHHLTTPDAEAPEGEGGEGDDRRNNVVDADGFAMNSPEFLNAFIGRLLYDVLLSDVWNEKVKRAIDNRLLSVRKPVMVESLTVKSLELGDSLPIINHAGRPMLDTQGLWVDLDVGFVGEVVITLEAFINVFRISSEGTHDTSKKDVSKVAKDHHKSKTSLKSQSKTSLSNADGEDDDSGDSSESDEDMDVEQEVETETAGTSSSVPKKEQQETSRKNSSAGSSAMGKIKNYTDTWKSKSKTSVFKNKFVQKVISGISTTPFLLTVKIQRVMGSVAVNVAPVPTDRVWVGFKGNPVVEIKVKPKVGQRVVSLNRVTEWIKRRLLLEFQRVMVCPNMVNVVLPLTEFELPK